MTPKQQHQQLEKVGEEREKILAEARKEAEGIVSQAYDRVDAVKKDAAEDAKMIIQKAQVDAKEEELRLLKGVRDQVAIAGHGCYPEIGG